MGSGRPAAAATRAVPAGTGSGEADGLDARVGHEGDAEFGTRPEEQREGAGRQAGIGDRFADRAADEFGGAGVRVVGLDDDRAAGGQRRCGVAAGDREGQREVAGAEDGDGTQRDRRAGECQAVATGVRSGSAGSMRAPFQLPSRSTPANRRSWPVVRPTSPVMRASGQSGLRDGAGDDVVADGLDVGGDGLQELGALLGRRGSVGGEGRGGGGACGVDVGLVAVVVDGFEVLPGAGIEAADRRAGSVNG